MDAKENLVLRDGSPGCYLTITDEHSGAGLAALVFPPGRISQLPLDQLRQRLIDTFARWGKPGAMRVDNGLPLGSPTRQLTPWLCG